MESLLDLMQFYPPDEDQSPQEQAEDLVLDAYELSPAKARANLKKALKLDPDCIAAYEFLASLEPRPEKAIALLESGIAIGKALVQNKFVAPKILSRQFKPEFPEFYTFGGKDEAAYYTTYAYPVWHQIPGAVEWLKKQVQ